jgi:hypothetical protein
MSISSHMACRKTMRPINLIWNVPPYGKRNDDDDDVMMYSNAYHHC